MSTAADIERFVLDVLARGTGLAEIDPLENLLFTGLVDSSGLMELVGSLEERYEIVVGDDDISPENFESIAAIAAFVDRRRAGRGG